MKPCKPCRNCGWCSCDCGKTHPLVALFWRLVFGR